MRSPAKGATSCSQTPRHSAASPSPDIEQAQEFYGSKLGIKVTEENGMLTLHLDGGDRPTLIYPKPDHEPAGYTILNFQVEDVEKAVDELVGAV